ncbi:MAG: DMT family protein [Muribaculaceae bacterium]|nr:DMT family protein [Muribaculaceae bacterium]
MIGSYSGLITVGMLLLSNVLMTFAWYGHLKLQNMGVSTHWPLIAVILFSWGIAFFEYLLAVPANRIGYAENGGPFSLIELKVIQEVITLTVFSVIVTVVFKGEPLHWNHAVAFLMLVGAVYFAFLEVK